MVFKRLRRYLFYLTFSNSLLMSWCIALSWVSNVRIDLFVGVKCCIVFGNGYSVKVKIN